MRHFIFPDFNTIPEFIYYYCYACYIYTYFMLLAVLRRWSRCSYSMCLYGLYYGALHVLKSSRALYPRVSSFLLALWSPRLVCVLLVHLFVCFVSVSSSHCSLPLRFGGWLRFVIVTLLSNYIYINWYLYRCPYCMLLLLHSIKGLVTQKIDKKVQMYAMKATDIETTYSCPDFLHNVGL